MFWRPGGDAIAGWRSVTRLIAGGIGAGSVIVGSFQFAAPRRAARRFGIELGNHPTSVIMVRGAGARDCFTGSALLYSAARGSAYQPWLAMRAAADAADGLAGALALLSGAKGSTQAKTTRSALMLSSFELLLWRISSHKKDVRPGTRGVA